jgi:GNAT superfamily N-acetyltransferase
MWPRREAKEFKQGAGDGNKRELQKLVRTGAEPGLLAYADGEPVGWVALAPRAEYRRLENSRVLAPIDDQPVWSVTCFFVRRDWRKRGLTGRLLREAAMYAASRGATVLEGYPTDTNKPVAAAFVWTGIASTFEGAGFREVARRSASRPIMRRTLRAGAAAKKRVKPAARTVKRAPAATKPRARRAKG